MSARTNTVAACILGWCLTWLGCMPDLPHPRSEEDDCTSMPKSRPLSEACCADHGIDACGAGLFCAAFDGRKQTTCYPEYSRVDMAECTEDRHCSSGSCNTQEQRCRSKPTTSCTLAIGCAPDAVGARYGCFGYERVCLPIGDGHPGERCIESTDCRGGTCADQRCKVGLGENCRPDKNSCAEGDCMDCNGRTVWCQSHDQDGGMLMDTFQCLQWCDSGFWQVSCE